MCTFVTLIAASDDLDRLNAILAGMDRRGYTRRAERVETPCLRAHLRPGEREYWLIHGPCDCATVLGSADPTGQGPWPGLKGTPDARADRYRRKGWTEARIARALADAAGAATPMAPANEDAGYWIALLRGVGAELGLPRLGLMQSFYRHGPGVDDVDAARVEGGPVAAAAPVLARMARGVIHDFTVE